MHRETIHRILHKCRLAISRLIQTAALTCGVEFYGAFFITGGGATKRGSIFLAAVSVTTTAIDDGPTQGVRHPTESLNSCPATSADRRPRYCVARNDSRRLSPAPRKPGVFTAPYQGTSFNQSRILGFFSVQILLCPIRSDVASLSLKNARAP